MKAVFELILVLSFNIYLCHAVSFITPCQSSDTKCLKSSAQAAVPILARGVPEFGVSSMDPMKIDRIKANQAGLKMDFRNVIVTDLAGCIVEKLKRPTEAKMSLEMKCNTTLTGDYTLSGRLLLIPIEGDGAFVIKIKSIIVKINFDIDTVTGADGLDHWVIVNPKKSYDVPQKGGNAHFHFDNLFNGNKVLSDTIHTVANTAWHEILNEVAPPIVSAIIDRIILETDKFFMNAPINQLSL